MIEWYSRQRCSYQYILLFAQWNFPLDFWQISGLLLSLCCQVLIYVSCRIALPPKQKYMMNKLNNYYQTLKHQTFNRVWYKRADYGWAFQIDLDMSRFEPFQVDFYNCSNLIRSRYHFSQFEYSQNYYSKSEITQTFPLTDLLKLRHT